MKFIKNIYLKILITFDFLNNTFMTWHKDQLSLIASKRVVDEFGKQLNLYREIHITCANKKKHPFP
jgi:hypothetical protein